MQPKKEENDDKAPPVVFQPRARILRLLGDQLIGSNRLALFELVKNSYDAGAHEVLVRMEKIGTSDGKIVVRDTGEGMSLATIKGAWLEPGSDHKKVQRNEEIEARKTDPDHKPKRLPLGEKGVGRFAVHKLGNKIKVVTRAEGQPEQVIDIDWNKLTSTKYLKDAEVSITEGDGSEFAEGKTGTYIEITELRGEWKRGEVRRLYRDLTSMTSPKKLGSDFVIEFQLPDNNDWLEGLYSADKVLKEAMWVFSFTLENGLLEWTYSFTPLAGMKLESRELKDGPENLELVPEDRYLTKHFTEDGEKQITVLPEMMNDIGTIIGDFYMYDRDQDIARAFYSSTQQILDYLDNNGGVKVYRDGMRVYNYGEHGDDWLGIDLRRIQRPTERVSRNLILGSVELSLELSRGLSEKTNREGFQETQTFEIFRALVRGVLAKAENLREFDKSRLRQVIHEGPSKKSPYRLDENFSALREELQKRDLPKIVSSHVNTIERRYKEMRDMVTRTGVGGKNLQLVFHEVERGVRSLRDSLKRKKPVEKILEQAEDLVTILEGFSSLIKKEPKKEHKISDIIKEAIALNELRFEFHKTIVSSPVLNGDQEDAVINCHRGLLIGAVSNLIDNALYWLEVKHPRSEKNDDSSSKRAIQVGISYELEKGIAIYVADNGPGLSIEPHEALEPFLTMKPHGMGLGLYYTNLVMEINDGKVAFLEAADLGISEAYDGAVVALVFEGQGT